MEQKVGKRRSALASAAKSEQRREAVLAALLALAMAGPEQALDGNGQLSLGAAVAAGRTRPIKRVEYWPPGQGGEGVGGEGAIKVIEFVDALRALHLLIVAEGVFARSAARSGAASPAPQGSRGTGKLSRLSVEELKTLRGLLLKAAGRSDAQEDVNATPGG